MEFIFDLTRNPVIQVILIVAFISIFYIAAIVIYTKFIDDGDQDKDRLWYAGLVVVFFAGLLYFLTR